MSALLTLVSFYPPTVGRAHVYVSEGVTDQPVQKVGRYVLRATGRSLDDPVCVSLHFAYLITSRKKTEIIKDTEDLYLSIYLRYLYHVNDNFAY